ncbi:dihydrofolate reductase family protein [Salsipaludibacter albus]|uniref:dihydrofolate reductase family protein n=1 Tax=Salsipaludibacter albus TaxID=2849650 RepID=UPI001EE426DF|nr:dihydrofolate reductase family protein [Salsipaludibacter albus]MBY5162669.1 dihydrofolate reductase family protein [Salsipaludibacter albus]
MTAPGRRTGPRVIGDISMSVDGFVTCPDPGPDRGLGRGGEPLHAWAIDSTHDVDRNVLARSSAASGAVVMGRRLFDIIDSSHGWNDEMGYGADQAATPPFFVVTRSPPARVRLDLDFTFVDTPAEAIERARTASGEQDVVVMGGAMVLRSCLDEGLLDELRLHVAPILLGGGTPLFDAVDRRELGQREVVVSPHATHLTYQLR